MRILLPPSEGKRGGGDGACLTELTVAPTALSRHRDRLARAVVRTSARRAGTARAAFGLPPAVADQALLANRTVLSSGTRPALERYTGVVYAALAANALDEGERACADRAILIFSGLFGVLTATEPIPDYRVPASAVLPRIGNVGRSWRALLVKAVPDLVEGDVVIDLRSSDYRAMWRATPANPTITVRVLSRRPDGALGITSYLSKQGKGQLARRLVAYAAHGHHVADAQHIAQLWVESGLGAVAAVRPGADGHVDVVTPD